MGKNKIAELCSSIFMQAGLEHNTNHAMRKTGLSNMAAVGMTNQQMMRVSGHRSVAGLLPYQQ